MDQPGELGNLTFRIKLRGFLYYLSLCMPKIKILENKSSGILILTIRISN